MIQYVFTLPQTVHYGTPFAVTVTDAKNLGSNEVIWTLQKDGEPAQYTGTLGADGGLSPSMIPAPLP